MREANKNNIKTLLPRGFLFFFLFLTCKTLDTQLVRVQAHINAFKSLAASPPDGRRIRCMQINPALDGCLYHYVTLYIGTRYSVLLTETTEFTKYKCSQSSILYRYLYDSNNITIDSVMIYLFCLNVKK